MNQSLLQIAYSHSRFSMALQLGFLVLLSVAVGGLVAIVSRNWIIGGLVSALILTLLTRYPELSLAMLMTGFTLYLLAFDRLGIYTSSTTTIAYYVIIALSGLLGSVRIKLRALILLLRKNWALCLLLFVIWLTVNWFLFSLTNKYAQSRMALMMLLGIIPFFSSLLLSKKQLERLLKWSAVFSGATMLSTLYQLFVQGMRFTNTRATAVQIERVTGTTDFNALWVAYIIAAGMIILWCLVLTNPKPFIFIFASIFSLLAVVTMISTGSRGPLLAVGLVLGFLLTTLNLRYKFSLLLFVGLLCLILFGSSMSSFDLRGTQRILTSINIALNSSIATFDELDFLSAGRFSLWRLAITLWQENPWTGVGIGNFPGLYAHNLVLELLSEYGLVGFVLFCGFLLGVGQAGYSIYQNNRNDFVTLSALGVLILSLGQLMFSGNIQNSVMFWIASALVLNLGVTQTQQPAARA